MNPSSDLHGESFQRVLARALAMQERRDFAAEHSAQLEPKEILVPERPIPEVFGEIEGGEDNSVPEFMMLPENRHSLRARWGAVIVGVMELWGFRHLALAATILTRRGSTVSPQHGEQDFVPAPVAPAASQEAKVFKSRSRWRNFALPAVAAALALRAKSFDWPTRWGKFATTEVAAGFLRQAKNMNWSIRRPNFGTMTFVSGLAHRARNLHRHGPWRKVALTSFPSGFAQRAQNLNWSNLRRCSAPAAVIAVVLAFTFLMVYKPYQPAKVAASSALPGGNAKAIGQSSSISKPFPGEPAPAETASTSPKPIAPATKTPRRMRQGSNEVEYKGDDVIVRRFTDRPKTQPSRLPNRRIAHIGDDVTVRYFASPPPARTATR